MKEIITVAVGSAGVNIAQSVWAKLAAEHDIQPSEKPTQIHETELPGELRIDNPEQIAESVKEDESYFHSMFSELESGSYRPRAILADYDPFPINKFLTSEISHLFEAESQLFSGTGDSNDKFGNGYSNDVESGAISAEVMEGIRLQLEDCEDIDGITFFHSTSGGTGSGLTARLLSELDTDYGRKLSNICVSILPAPNISINHIEYYNTVMWLNSFLNYSDAGIMLDNQAGYQYAK